jgi:hypothetical protein
VELRNVSGYKEPVTIFNENYIIDKWHTCPKKEALFRGETVRTAEPSENFHILHNIKIESINS